MCDSELILNCANEGLRLSKKENTMADHAIFHRLKGLYYILTSDYKNAIANLIKSIDYLESSNSSNHIYNTNIAAAYNYMGELHRKQMHFNKAVSYYKKAIALTEDKNVLANPTFYANLGRTYYDMKEYEKSSTYIKKAYDVYSISSIMVGRATTLAYMAFYSCIEKNDYKQADNFLIEAEKTANKINSPLEKGIVRYIQYILSLNYKDFLSQLSFEPQYYEEEYKNYFKPFNENYFLQTML